MESIISALIGGAVAVITCLINNNVQRTKEQHAIEMQLQAVNANYDKQTSIIKEQICTLTEHVNQHNNLIDRMYKVEELTTKLSDMDMLLSERISHMEQMK